MHTVPLQSSTEALRAIMRSFEFEPAVVSPAVRSLVRHARRPLANRKSKIQNQKS
jgi:hypothetical protein